MKTVQVSSSSISEVGFGNGTLEITFTNGKTYQYFNVPEETFEEMIASDSVGKFFNSVIRNNYSSIKLN